MNVGSAFKALVPNAVIVLADAFEALIVFGAVFDV